MLMTWCDFFLLMLWLFFFASMLMLNNLLNLLMFSELIWICLYMYASVMATLYNSMFIFIMGLFLLGIATCETAVGLSLLMLRMSIFGSMNNNDTMNKKNYFIYKNKNISLVNSKMTNV